MHLTMRSSKREMNFTRSSSSLLSPLLLGAAITYDSSWINLLGWFNRRLARLHFALSLGGDMSFNCLADSSSGFHAPARSLIPKYVKSV